VELHRRRGLKLAAIRCALFGGIPRSIRDERRHRRGGLLAIGPPRLDELCLGPHPEIGRSVLPVFERLAQALSRVTVRRIVDEILRLVGISAEFIELLGGKWLLDPGKRVVECALAFAALEHLRDGMVISIRKPRRWAGCPVTDVLVLRISNHPLGEIADVLAVAGGEHVLPGVVTTLTKYLVALKMPWRRRIGHLEHRPREVHVAHEFCPVFCVEFARPAHDQRDVDTTVVQPGFAAGQALAVVRPDNDYRILSEIVGLEALE